MPTSSAVVTRETLDPVPCATFEEYLVRAEGVRAEWVNGRILYMTAASFLHQNMVGFLFALLHQFVEERDLGWVAVAPFVMHFAKQERGREPDILFVAGDRRERIRPTHLEGPADLAIEIISADSRSRDRREKRTEYEAAGVLEYWWIDPSREEGEFLHLGEDCRYRPLPMAEGIVSSSILPGFRLRPDWLWRQPLPKVRQAAAELGLF